MFIGAGLERQEKSRPTGFDPSPKRVAIPTTQARSPLMDVPDYTVSHTWKHTNNKIWKI